MTFSSINSGVNGTSHLRATPLHWLFYYRQSLSPGLDECFEGKFNFFSFITSPTRKFVEVIANIEGLVVVVCILVVDEFHSP